MTEKERLEDTQTARSPAKVLRHTFVCAVVVLALCLVLAAPAGAWEADTSWYDNNLWADEYVISTADELAGLAVIANTEYQFSGKTVKLDADIDLENQEWTPIGIWDESSDFPECFSGVFDGQGHTISNLYISNDSLSYVGLFGFASEATISNLNLVNVNVTGTNTDSDYGIDVGALVGFFDGGSAPEQTIITNCSVIGGTVSSISEMSRVGGLVGSTRYGPEISHSYAEVRVIGDSVVGGIVGNHNQAANMNYCTAKCTIITEGVAGGLVGSAADNSNIFASVADCDIQGYYDVGGIVGQFYGGDITDCFVNFNITTTGTLSNSGGIVGTAYQTTNITNCYSTGCLVISNHYSIPHTEGNGGLIGSQSQYAQGPVNIINSVSLMQYVYGFDSTGRLAGTENVNIVNSYAWEGMTNNGVLFSEGGINGTSVSSAQFWNTQSFFEDVLGWDFTNTWKMNSGNANAQLPVLQFMQTPVAGDVSYLLNSPSIPELKDTYIVGIDAEYPPFTYLDDNGNLTGFDVESILWIAEQQGFDVIIQPTDWNGIIPALNAGQIDMIYSGMSITPERAEQVTFSDPYWDVGCSIVVRTENSSVQVDDFINGNLVIGVVRGSLGDDWLSKELGTASYEAMLQNGSIKLFNDGYSSIIALENRFVDAVIHESYEVSDYLEGTSTLCVIESFVTQQYAVAMRNDDTALHEIINDGIAELKSSGKWDELAAKHMGVSSSNPTPTPVEEITVTSVEELAQVLDAEVSGNVVTLTHDVTLNKSISLEIDGEVILTTSGDYTIYRGVADYSLFNVKRPTFLTLRGKDADNQLTIDGRKDVFTENTKALITLYIDGTLNISEHSVLTNNVVNNGQGSGVDVRTVQSTVFMNGGSITGNDVVGEYGFGGGINTYGRVIMNSGSISNNTAVSMGGGVYVAHPASFEMYGGEISHNHARTGGAVSVDGESVTYDSEGVVTAVEYGIFNMSGGHISDNTGESVPGIFNYGIIHISGGEISNHSGFAVSSGGGNIILTGGTFSNNTYAVYLFDGSTGTDNDNGELVYWYSNGKLSISGDAMIPASEAVSVNDNSTIRVTGPLSANAGVYNIKTNKESGVVVDATSAGISGEDLLSHFTLSKYGYSLAADGYTLVLSSSGSEQPALFIGIDSITNVTQGTPLELSGTTNLPAGTVLDVILGEVTESSDGVEYTGTVIVRDVGYGNGTFVWNCTVDTSDLKSGEKVLIVTDTNGDIFGVGYFSILGESVTPSLTLVKGWNFVSVPKALDASCNTAVKLFGSVDTGGAAVLEYNASSQSWEQVTANTVIKPLSAYWIYSKTAVTIPLTYSDVPTAPGVKSLYPGWNAVGLSAATDTAASSFFAGLEWRVAVPWNSENGAYDLSIVNGGTGVNSADRMLSLGSGCWLYVEEADVLPGLTA